MNVSHKEIIKKILCSVQIHPSADWLYTEVKKEIPNIALGTIYRNLKIMKKSGEISEVCVLSGRKHYDGNTMDHAHFICELCGLIMDLPEIRINDSVYKVISESGIKITRKRIELYGMCPACQKKAGSSNAGKKGK